MPITFSIYVEEELLRQIEAEAKRDDRPVSAMARVLIREALKAREDITAYENPTKSKEIG